MKFYCRNCGSTSGTIEDDMIVCDECHKKYHIEDVEDYLSKQETRKKDFLKRNEELFKINVIDDTVTNDELLKQINALKKSLNKSIDEKTAQLKLENIDDLQNILESRLPEAKIKLPDGQITIKESIDRVNPKSMDDFNVPAFLLRNNVEGNLIENFNVPHEGTNFYLNFDEFKNICNSVKDSSGQYPLKRQLFTVNAIEKDKNGKPTKVSLKPIMRFVKAGFPYNIAKKAAKYWGTLNCFIHPSPENKEIVQQMLNDGTLKQTFINMYNFFKTNKLVTE